MLKRYASLEKALDKTIENLEISEEDTALVALAYDIAARLVVEKSGRTAAELAGKLMTALTALGATPEARKAMKEATRDQSPSGPNELERLRQRRAASGRA